MSSFSTHTQKTSNHKCIHPQGSSETNSAEHNHNRVRGVISHQKGAIFSTLKTKGGSTENRAVSSLWYRLACISAPILSFCLAMSWQGQKCTGKQKVETPLTQKTLIGGSVSHIISQRLLGSLQQKQQLWQRNSLETVRFQGTESFRGICLSTRTSWNLSVIDTVAGSPLRERLSLPCLHDPSTTSWTFWLRKRKMESFPTVVGWFQTLWEPWERKNYYLRKGFYMRTHRTLFSTQGVEDKTDAYQWTVQTKWI